MDNHINSIQKSEKWVLCGNCLKNVEFDQYLYIELNLDSIKTNFYLEQKNDTK